jgi:hypothetical protein
MNSKVIETYLDLLDSQREAAFSALEGLNDAQVWQRPAPNEWSIGEILDHNYLLIASSYPLVKLAWNTLAWYGKLRRKQPYTTEIDDVYRRKTFPMWTGFQWTPRYNPRKPAPLETLKAENRELHTAIRAFYTSKDEDMLGNIYLYDPVFGLLNLIVTLRIGIYHDQLHYDDVFKLATESQI